MSEESKATVQYIYEDEFSYVTESGELVQKAGDHIGERRIADLKDIGSEEELAGEIKSYREAFAELKEQVDEVLSADEITLQSIDDLYEQVTTATAVGDYDKLVSRIEQAKNELREEAQSEDTTAEEPEDGKEDENTETTEDDPLAFYEKIAERAEELARQTDWPYVSMELDNLSHEWDEGPDIPEDEKDRAKKLLSSFQAACDTFEERKEEHYKRQKEQKKENLEKKKNLLDQLSEIVEAEKWGAIQKVNRIKGKWNSVGRLPKDTGDQLDQKFDTLLEEFREHKVDRLVSKRQQQEDNLTGKLIVLGKMEDLAGSIDENTDNWKTIDSEFDRLTKQFKKIGRVPGEKSDEVWGRFKSAQDEYYDKKYKFHKKHQKQVDKFFQKKEKLCEQAEALLDEEDLPKAARQINRLHHKWKKVGNLPQRDEDKLWARFKNATDEFNQRKSDNIDELHQQEQENYEKKMGLVEKAREHQDMTDWDRGHELMQDLLREWKKIGPVPRKKSRQVWKKFKKAQDVFYERRREHFQEQKEQQKENLKEKQEILEKLQELGGHNDPIEAVNLAKPLQEEFKNVGYVPIKRKNKIWNKYKKACDVIYERYRAAKSGNKFDQELAKADLEPDQRSKIMDMRKQYKKIKNEVRKLEGEMLQYEESMTYFKPTDSSSPLLDEIQEKVDKVEEKLENKREKLDSIDRKIEDLTES